LLGANVLPKTKYAATLTNSALTKLRLETRIMSFSSPTDGLLSLCCHLGVLVVKVASVKEPERKKARVASEAKSASQGINTPPPG
jgi:hypothetical protein